MEIYRRGAQRRRGAQCYGVAWRPLVWSLSAARTSAGGCCWRMERGRNGRRKYGRGQREGGRDPPREQGHVTWAGRYREDEICLASRGARHADAAEQAGNADRVGASEVCSASGWHGWDPSERTDDLTSITTQKKHTHRIKTLHQVHYEVTLWSFIYLILYLLL
jgi:hypothetical protein